MDKWAEAQKWFQNIPKKQPYVCHLPSTMLVHSQPQFATHLPLPLQYNGFSLEGPSVRANNKKYTKGIQVGIQINSILVWFILSCCLCTSVKIWLIYYPWEITDPGSLIQVFVVPQNFVMNMCVYMCVHSCTQVCLIGIVSISKRPDSHPPSLCATKGGQLMMLWMRLDQLSMLMLLV